MRVVLDTNVYISALISSHSAPSHILTLWELHTFDLRLSPTVFAELERVLHYPKIVRRLRTPEATLARLLTRLREQATWVEPAQRLALVADEPGNRFLEIAFAGRATCIITGDAHLLQMGSFEEIPILSPAAFLTWLAALEAGEPT
jgi:putative PIN family toxin of toxin-antitoxin system